MSTVRVERAGAVATVTLSRPEAANALSKAVVADLRAALSSLASDAALAAVILTGAGDKAFCAGADLKERRGLTLDQTRDVLDELGRSDEPGGGVSPGGHRRHQRRRLRRRAGAGAGRATCGWRPTAPSWG